MRVTGFGDTRRVRPGPAARYGPRWRIRPADPLV